jgi:hypothetical protein
MPFVPIPYVTKFALVWLGQGKQYVCTLHIDRQAGWTVADAALQASNLVGWWSTAGIRAETSSQIALDRVEYVDQASQTGFSGAYIPVAALPGLSNDAAIDANTAFGVKFKTDQRGRSYRGRIHIPGIRVGQRLNSQTWTTALVNTIGQSFVNILPYLITGATQVIASRFLNGAPRATGIATQVRALSAENNFDSQRSRMLRD